MVSLEDEIDKKLRSTVLDNQRQREDSVDRLPPKPIFNPPVSDSSLSDDEIDRIVKGSSIVVDKSNDNDLGKDIQVVTKEFTDDRNVYRFGFMNKRIMCYDALLGAVSQRPKDRYELMSFFRHNLSVNMAAVKGAQADRFKDMVSSLLGFRAMLAYREAGVSNPLEDEKRHGLLDRLKK